MTEAALWRSGGEHHRGQDAVGGVLYFALGPVPLEDDTREIEPEPAAAGAAAAGFVCSVEGVEEVGQGPFVYVHARTTAPSGE